MRVPTESLCWVWCEKYQASDDGSAGRRDRRTRQESNRAIIVENDVGEEEDTEDVRVLETREMSGRSLT